MDGNRGYWDRPSPHIRLGVTSRILAGYDVERAVALAAAVGYEGIVLYCDGHLPHDMDDEWVEGLRQQLSNHGLDVIALATACGHFATLGDEECEIEVQRLWRYLLIAERLGCPAVHVSPGGPTELGRVREDHLLRAAHYLREVCDMALGRRLEVLIENEPGITSTVDGTLHLITLVDRPNLLVSYSPGCLGVTDRYYGIEAIERMAHVLVDVRVKDVVLLGPSYGQPALLGEGDLDYRAIIAWLKANSYQGFLSADCDPMLTIRCSALDILRHEYAALRQLIDES
ncbi:MAG: sugar phosphate isomerase/epimerase [Armatimonadetes bacterium]|nr:sugar phosphate isomerase/epimerase [Armatimonadota bacterium]